MTQTFHSDSEVPAGVSFNDGTPLSTGLYFTVAVDGTITHARWRAGVNLEGTVKWALYRLSDSVLLDEQDITSYTPDAWNTVALTSPIPVSAATEYAAVFWSPNTYAATSNYFPESITRGDITAEETGGRFVEPSADIQIPTDSFNNGCYFVDFVFEPGSAPSGPAVTVWDGTSEVAATVTVWDGTTEQPASITEIAS